MANERYRPPLSEEELSALASAVASVLQDDSLAGIIEAQASKWAFRTITVDLENVAMSAFSLSDPIGQIVHTVENILGTILSTVENAVKNAVNWAVNNLINPAIGALKTVVNSLVDAVNKLPAAIGNLVNLLKNFIYKQFTNLLRAIDSLKDAILNLPNLIRKALGDLIDFLPKLPDLVKQAVLGALGKLWDLFKGMLDWMRENLPKLFEAINTLKDTIVKWFNILKGVISELSKDIGSMLNQYVLRPLQDLLGTIQRHLSPILKDILDFLSNNVGPVLHKVWEGITYLVAKFDEFWERVGNALSNAMDYLGKLWDGFQKFVANIGSMLNQYAVQPILKALGSMINAILDNVRHLPELISGLGRTLGNIWNAIQTFFTKTLPSTISGAVQTLQNWISNAFKTLQTLLGQLGANIMNAINGLIQSVSQLPKIIQGIGSEISNWFGKLWNWLSSGLWNAINSLLKSVDQLNMLFQQSSKAIGQWFSRLWNMLQSLFQKTEEMPIEIVNQLQPLWQPVAEGVEEIRNTIQQSPIKTPETFTIHVQEAVKPPVHEAQNNINTNVVEQHNVTRAKVEEVGRQLHEKLLALNKTIASVLPPNTVCSYTSEEYQKFITETLYKPLGELVTKKTEEVRKVVIKELPQLLERRIAGQMKTQLQPINENIVVVKQTAEQIAKTEKEQSNVLQEIGNWIRNATNTITGFVNTVGELVKTIQDLFGKAPDLIENLLSFFEDPSDLIGSIMNAIASSLGDFYKAVVKTFSSIKDTLGTIFASLGNTFGGAISTAAGALRALIDAMINAIRAIASDAGAAAGSLVRDVIATTKGVASGIWKSIIGILSFGKWFTGTDLPRASPNAIDVLGMIYEKAPINIMALVLNMPWMMTSQIASSMAFVSMFVSRLAGAIASALNAEIGINIFGIEGKIKIKDVIKMIVKGIANMFYDIARATYEGMALGIAFNVTKPLDPFFRAFMVKWMDSAATDLYGMVVPHDWYRYAFVNAFAKEVSETKLRDFARRLMALGLYEFMMNQTGEAQQVAKMVTQMLITGQYPNEWVSRAINTVRTHMVLSGLPMWFIDFYTSSTIAIEWVDRFGNPAYFLLGELFELPTHSELARMVIKDIIPNIKMMYALGWLRGWPPDVTKSLYLMNFKYPTFEKLLRFYYRAISGMLWYEPSREIRALFGNEARALGTDEPISPYEIATALNNPRAFAALETALGVYFKWLEYSNFPWISRNTVVNDIPIGQIVYDGIGGWLADSWMLADVAAEIPSKIDQRWMSRFGIFLWMIERGWNPADYTPLVDVLPQLLEQAPTSPIQLDLRSHAKLIQATGLHPAWVPIVTVAENIMVITDEMTLMRTGWLNLFKSGLLTLDQVERYLSGIIEVSYLTMYFDQHAKEWRSAWINLPVRWLPHERKLLQIRMTIDRVMNLFREFYNYLRSAVRNLALPVEGTLSISTEVEGTAVRLTVPGMKDLLYEFVGTLNNFFSKAMKEITGKDMNIGIDSDFINMWIDLEEKAQQIETLVKARYLWYRLAGYLIYRLAYGYVTLDDVKKLVDDVSSVIPITPEEKALYLIIFRNVLGIMVREYIPTPSQFATVSEYVPKLAGQFENEFLQNGIIPEDSLFYQVLKERHVPKEWWPIWAQYVIARTRADDARRIATELANLYAHRLVDDAAFERIFSQYLAPYGWDEKEKELLKEYAVLRRMYVWDWQRYVGGTPTPNELTRLAEYLAPVLLFSVRPTFPTITQSMSYIDLAFEVRGVPKEWRPVWKAYVWLRNVFDEVRRAVTALITAYGRGAVKTDDEFLSVLNTIESTVFDLLPPELQEQVQQNLGGRVGWLFTHTERHILLTIAKLHRQYTELRNILPTPMQLGTIAEVVPETIERLEELWQYQFYPEPYDTILKAYVQRRRFADEKRMLERSIARAVSWGVSEGEINKLLASLAQIFGFDSVEALFRYIGLSEQELELAKVRAQIDVLYEEYREAHRAWAPTPLTLSNILDIIKIDKETLDRLLSSYRIPDQFRDIVYRYVQLRPYINEAREVVRWYYNLTVLAYQYTNAVYSALGDLQSQVQTVFEKYNVDEEEQSLLDLYARIRALYDRARRGYTASIPTLAELARIVETVPEASSLLDWLFQHYLTPREWQDVWRKYVERRPVADEIRRYITALITAYAYSAITGDDLATALNALKEWGWTDTEISYLLKVADLRKKYVETRLEAREYIPTPLTLAAVAEVVPSAVIYIDDILKYRNVPQDWWDLWRQYVQIRPIADDVRRMMTAYARALRYGASLGDLEQIVLEWARKAGWTDTEIELLKLRVQLEALADEAREAQREYIPTPLTLAAVAEHVPSAVQFLDQVLERRHVPDEWKPLWRQYVQIRPIADEVRRLLTTAITAYAYSAITTDELQQIFNFAKNYGWTDAELAILQQVADLRKKYVETRLEAREYIPTPTQMATIVEYVPSAAALLPSVFEARNVPEEWRPIWAQYIQIRPIADEIRRLLTTAITAYAYGAITSDTLQQIFNFAKNYGWTDAELNILMQIAALRVREVEARLAGREYIPTPSQLATIAEYVPSAADKITEVLQERHVPEDWWPIWEQYVKVRPVADEIRRLLTAAITAYAYGAITSDELQQIFNFAKNYGWTDAELSILLQVADLRARYVDAREEGRSYIPTPYQLGTIAEYVPWARNLLQEVFEARHVPPEWRPLWEAYVSIRPIYDEVRRIITALVNLYEHFAIDDDTLNQIIQILKNYGIGDLEAVMIDRLAKLRAQFYAWREVIGNPKSLTVMAEYSPTARQFALGLVSRMIDSLPIDEDTKNLLKAMWEEYIRIKPVYDEVRRYVNELINDYAYGAIDLETLENELNELREWGLDDYEIQFYIWLAQKRRIRVIVQQQQYYGI